MVIFDLLADTLMEMLPRLVAEKIGVYLYHWKHLELMKEMKNRIIIINQPWCKGILLMYDRLHRVIDYDNGKLYMHRHQGDSPTGIYNHTKVIIRYDENDNDDGRHPWLDYIAVAQLPKNYWYSGIIPDE